MYVYIYIYINLRSKETMAYISHVCLIPGTQLNVHFLQCDVATFRCSTQSCAHQKKQCFDPSPKFLIWL